MTYKEVTLSCVSLLDSEWRDWTKREIYKEVTLSCVSLLGSEWSESSDPFWHLHGLLCTPMSVRDYYLLNTSTSGWLHQPNSWTPTFSVLCCCTLRTGVGWLIDWLSPIHCPLIDLALLSFHRLLILIDWTAVWLILVDWLILNGRLMLGDWLVSSLCQLIGFGSGSCPLFDCLIGWLCPLVIWLVLCVWLNAECWQNLSAD